MILFFWLYLFVCFKGMSTQRKQARLFRRSVELKIMKEIFTEWLNGAQQLQLARRTHEHNIIRRYKEWKTKHL